MVDTRNHILQITDEVTTRRCALRIEPGDAGLLLQELLQRYLKEPQIDRLLAERRITDDSAETLGSLQDMVYVCTDEGLLRDMFAGVVFRQDASLLSLDEAPTARPVRLEDKDVLLTDLVIDRTSVGYDRNWTGFHRRRWDLRSDEYSGFVTDCVEEAVGPSAASKVLELETNESKLSLMRALARKIWESDFENYSRFIDRKLVYKSGDETVRNIITGSGGICSEKVQALKFLTDRFGLESEYILAGPDVPDPAPEPRLRELLTTFDFRFAKRYMRYWQHTALLYRIDGSTVLVDDTNGNVPFLFLEDDEAQRVLGYDSKPPVKVRMTISEEDFYYHPISQDIARDLLFAMEGWIDHMDLVQVFDNELGLYISEDFMIAPIVFKVERTFERIRGEYLKACGQAGMECAIIQDWGLESPLAERFAQAHPDAADKVLRSREHLLARYDDCHGPGHDAGLVVIALRG